LNLARKSACIIIQVGASRNLRWEFETLKAEGLLEKAFIFTSPVKKDNAWNRFGQRSYRFMERVKGIKPVVWSEFAAGMRAIGYEIDSAEPAHGSIFTFDREGSAVLVTTGALEPADFVGVMVEQLQLTANDPVSSRN
jgi:hypothetical protein